MVMMTSSQTRLVLIDTSRTLQDLATQKEESKKTEEKGNLDEAIFNRSRERKRVGTKEKGVKHVIGWRRHPLLGSNTGSKWAFVWVKEAQVTRIDRGMHGDLRGRRSGGHVMLTESSTPWGHPKWANIWW
ncbi:hypothetical protein B296_00058746 [Ensete ventricosum]|uniref:Uncharacterized protein n=1 Tax=Ensete ventricosum TaxID=4639 RepID=A0A426XI08_ENSVE|nr:hypothetical protein B296_00058746 [Ensete ventricosum]